MALTMHRASPIQFSKADTGIPAAIETTIGLWVSESASGSATAPITWGFTANTTMSAVLTAAPLSAVVEIPWVASIRWRDSAFGSLTKMSSLEKPLANMPPIKHEAILPPPIKTTLLIMVCFHCY